MCPHLSSYNSVYGHLADPKKVGQFHLRESGCGVKRPNFQNFGIRKFGLWVAFSYGKSLSFKAVLHVFQLAASLYVVWICAARVVAVVYNNLPRRKGSLSAVHPSQSVRENLYYLPSEPKIHLSVTRFVGGCLPKPTLFRNGYFNFGPKPFLRLFRKKLFHQSPWDTFGLHQSVRLIVCHAFGCANSARAISF